MPRIRVGTTSDYVADGLVNGQSYNFRIRAGDGTDAGSSPWSAAVAGTPSAPVVGPRRPYAMRLYALAARATGMSMDFVARVGPTGTIVNLGKGAPESGTDLDWLLWSTTNFRWRWVDVLALIAPDGTLKQENLDTLQVGMLATGSYTGTGWNDVRAMFVRVDWTDGTFSYLRPDGTPAFGWETLQVEGEAGATAAHHVLDDPITPTHIGVGTAGYVQTTGATRQFLLDLVTTALPVAPVLALTRGVSDAGGEFGTPGPDAATTSFSNANPGTYDTHYHYSKRASLEYYSSRGIRHLRLPFRLERLFSPTAVIVAAERDRIRRYLDDAALSGHRVLLDAHNYGAYYVFDGTQGVRRMIGSAEFTRASFASMCRIIYETWGAHPAFFGLAVMNEPFDPARTDTAGHQAAALIWEGDSEAARAAVRTVSDKLIVIGGYFFNTLYRIAVYHPDKWLTDHTNVWIDGHYYPDRDNSGRFVNSYDAEVENAATRLLNFRGDYETGDFSQWSGVQAPTDRQPTIVSDVVRQGTRAARFELQANDSVTIDGVASHRSEVFKSGTGFKFTSGMTRWFGLSLRPDHPNFADPTKWGNGNQMFVQWKNDGQGSAPIDIRILEDGRLALVDRRVFSSTAGLRRYWVGPRMDEVGMNGAWQDFEIGVHFSPDHTVGWIEVWYRGEQQQNLSGSPGFPARRTTSLTGADDDLTFTAKAVGRGGNAINVEYVNPGVANSALAVTLPAANAIRVSLATDGAGALISTALQVRDAINAHTGASALIGAALASGNSGAGVVTAMAPRNLTNGVWPATVSADGKRVTTDTLQEDNPNTTTVESASYLKQGYYSGSDMGFVGVVYHDRARYGATRAAVASGQPYGDKDLLHTRVLSEITTGTDWMADNGVQLYVGETGVPSENHVPLAEAQQWADLLEVIYDHFDAVNANVAQWASGEWWPATYESLAYQASTGASGSVDKVLTAGAVVERHLDRATDRTAPTVTITAGPVPGSESTRTSETFEFVANEPNVSYEVALDSDVFQPNGTTGRYVTPELSVGSHTFSVRAIDFDGNVSDPVSRTWTVLSSADRTAPPVPSNLTAVARSRAVDLAVNPSTATDFAEFIWERLDEAAWVERARTLGVTFTDTGLVNGVPRSYRVRAVDVSGNVSDPSVVVTATPSSVTMTTLDNVVIVPLNRGLRVIWDPPPEAEDVRAVRIYVKRAAEVAYPKEPAFSGVGAATGGRRYADVLGLENSQSYSLKVVPARAA